MPTYPYHCKACGHRFDEIQSFSEPVLTKCPACKKSKLERLFGGGGAIIFKGSGFYETDYRRAGEKPAEGSEPAKTESADAATKSDAKPDATAAASPPPPPPPAESKPAKAGKGKKDG